MGSRWPVGYETLIETSELLEISTKGVIVEEQLGFGEITSAEVS